MSQVKGYPKPCVIRCPSCGKVQPALVTFYERDPFPGYAHDCACGYLIIESEWEEVDLDKLTGRKPSRLSANDITALQRLVTQMIKHKGGVRRDPPEIRYADLGGLLVALEDLKANVEANHV